jgi:hypothetical protein
MNAKSGLLKNTGEWLLKNEAFRDWRSSSSSGIFWLHGIRELPLNSGCTIQLLTFNSGCREDKVDVSFPCLLS